MTVHTHTFTVEGRGGFPYDMLRYDMCYPADAESADNMRGDVFAERRQVTLRKVTRQKYHTITAKRWDSFGWLVVKADPATIR